MLLADMGMLTQARAYANYNPSLILNLIRLIAILFLSD
jgi:hypothetical protein